MNNWYQSSVPPVSETPSPQESTLPPPRRSLGARIMQWWHAFASPPEPPGNATVLQREQYRRARAVSVVVFVFLPLISVGLPSALSMPNRGLFEVGCSIVVALIIAPFLNRAGHVLLAGLFIVLTVQLVLVYYIITTIPLNETALQVYDLFSLVILLALAILPPRIIWIMSSLDCVFIILDFLYQPRTQEFTNLINHEGLLGILIRPLMIIFFLTGVSSFLLTSVANAVRQSYATEFMANVERAEAQQNELDAEAKRELEESIQQIVQAHTEALNGRTKEHIPYPSAKVLWPLVGILNTLWTRLQRSQQREQELSRLQEDILAYGRIVQRTVHTPEQPLVPYRTHSALSPLTLYFADVQRELLRRLRSERGE